MKARLTDTLYDMEWLALQYRSTAYCMNGHNSLRVGWHEVFVDETSVNGVDAIKRVWLDG